MIFIGFVNPKTCLNHQSNELILIQMHRHKTPKGRKPSVELGSLFQLLLRPAFQTQRAVSSPQSAAPTVDRRTCTLAEVALAAAEEASAAEAAAVARLEAAEREARARWCAPSVEK